MLDRPMSLSLSSQERCSSPLILFMALLWTLTDPCFSWAEDSRAGDATLWVVSREGRGGESRPSTFWPHCF